MGDAFRDRPTFKFLAGSQFVAHPPGWPDRPPNGTVRVQYRQVPANRWPGSNRLYVVSPSAVNRRT